MFKTDSTARPTASHALYEIDMAEAASNTVDETANQRDRALLKGESSHIFIIDISGITEGEEDIISLQACKRNTDIFQRRETRSTWQIEVPAAIIW